MIEATLAPILFAAAILKAFELFTNSSPLIRGLVHQKPILLAIIQAELLLAAWLLIGGLPRARYICVTTCFTLFAAVASYEALRALPSCGCFGEVKVPPLLTCAFDISAVIALWYTRPPFNVERCVLSVERCIPSSRVIAAVAVFTLASASLWTAYFLKQPSPALAHASQQQPGSLIVLEPDTWPGKPFPLIDEIEGGEKLRTGKWIVLLYHFDCNTCLQAIPEYLKLANQPNPSRIAFIAMPPMAGQDPVPDSPSYLHLALRPDHDWFATTPVLAKIENGNVLTAAEGQKALPPR